MPDVPSSMRRWTVPAYGPGGDASAAVASMQMEDGPVPQPGAGEVLVKVQVAAVNPIDWKLFTGGLDAVVPCTFPYTPGFDVAGEVAALGDGVADFKVGDAVCADIGLCETCKNPPPTAGCCGAFAEYAVVPTALLAKHSLSAEQIAGLPLVGLTSYQALFTGAATDFAGNPLGDIKAGSKLLVLGGSSVTGSFAIQMAKNVGATVVATASTNAMPDGTSKIDYVKSLGADVINYKTESFAEKLAGQDFDMIYDTVGDQEDLDVHAPKVLKKGGLFVSIANFNPDSKSTDAVRFANFLLKSDAKDLAGLVSMVEKGALKIPIDSVHSFEDVPKAISRNMTFRAGGKILIKICA